MLRVDGYCDASRFPCLVTFDYNVVISFSAEERGGARYVLIRNKPTNLLELTIAVNSMLLKGFVVTMTDQKHLSKPLDFGDIETLHGLPLIGLPQDVRFSGSYQHIAEVNSDFILAMDDALNSVDIVLHSKRCIDQVITHERVSFLVSDHNLVGIRVTSLSNGEQRCIKDHIARNAAAQ